MKFNVAWLKKSQIWFVVACVALSVLYAYFLFNHLGEHAFIDWDEGIYAQVAKDSFVHHNQLSLTFFGEPWFEKPPLVFWITEIGFALFGITEFGARLFMGVFALGTLAVTALLAYVLSRSRVVTLFTAAAFFLFSQVFASAFFLNTDTVLSFWVVLAMLGYALTRTNARWWLLFFGATGLAVMTKNVAGLYPLIIVGILAMLQRNFSFFRSRWFWWGAGLAVLIVLPWHSIQTVRYGDAFWQEYLLHHFVSRYITAIEHNGAPFMYFLDQIIRYPALAMLAVAGVLYGLWAGFRDARLQIPLVGFVSILLIISFSKTKLLGYAVPMYPFLAISIGLVVAALVGALKNRFLSATVGAILIVVFVFFGLEMNQYKVAKTQSNFSYQHSKNLGTQIQGLDPNKPVVVGPYEFSGLPALWFYADRKLDQLASDQQLPQVDVAQRRFYSTSKSLYELADYYYVRVDAYNP